MYFINDTKHAACNFIDIVGGMYYSLLLINTAKLRNIFQTNKC